MKKQILSLSIIFACFSSFAQSINIPINMITDEGGGKNIGFVNIAESPYGLLFTPDLKELSPGMHGFHIHENASCAPGLMDGKKVAGLSAGGHFDPEKTGKHLGPYNADGHLGDLPPVYVNNDGTATAPVLAPRLKSIKDIRHHAIMIHKGGDNHSDSPLPLGGGGGRIACGIIN
ncbi:superoxide dismutase [Cu-Zn] SodC [Escherichia coli]|nr:superoxide dismutase [Cu-Zn] SodC2 [Escherichia coli]MBB7314653.1 superoxide dismutase family protein [Escherichia coli]MCN6572240.1 superoxide dismutase [Cu-Zn] SodC [Escherichia coli]HBA7686833.1 superoxide dismutase [Cu-Zn] SodC2 [Escherichia coli]HBA7856476.1 superoxide dismutase [Cu-Zn] SodC2 [Escherichia coli]